MGIILYSLSLVVLFFLGVPIGFSLVLSGVFYILCFSDLDLIILPQKMAAGLNSFPLLAVNFYLLLGELMSRAGVTTRLVELGNALVGHIRGGLAQVTVVTNMFMGGISGSAVADTAAVGSVMIPAMRDEKYSITFATALNAAAGCLGPIIPPSLTMVIYGSLGNVSIGRLFLGGAIPGILLGIYLMIYSYVLAGRKGYGEAKHFFSWRRLEKSLAGAAFSLSIPLIIVVGIVWGIFTPTEAGAAAAMVVILLGLFVYRQLGWKEIWESIRSTVLTLGSCLIILAGAATFGWILTVEGAAKALGEGLLSISKYPLVIMFIINGILLILGCFVETIAIVILVTPVFLPVITALGYDPVHFGVVLVLNVTIGLVTPPLGVSMFVACSIAKISTDDFMKDMLPLYIPLLLGLLTTILFPQTVMYLPDLLMPVHK